MKTLFQLARFGIVGLVATAVHSGVYLAAIYAGAFKPVPANALGFAVAFLFSFTGHHWWTFADPANPNDQRTTFVRFALISLGGFACNSFLTWLLTSALHLPPATALLGFFGVTPMLVFLASKHWVFRKRRPEADL